MRGDLGVNTICGASNVSFGRSNRPSLNAAFIAMAIGAGMPCAIKNPLEEKSLEPIRAANLIMDHGAEAAR